MLCKHCNNELDKNDKNCCEACDVNEAFKLALAELIIAALIEAGPNQVMRTNFKFDEPDLRAVIYGALHLKTE